MRRCVFWGAACVSMEGGRECRERGMYIAFALMCTFAGGGRSWPRGDEVSMGKWMSRTD